MELHFLGMVLRSVCKTFNFWYSLPEIEVLPRDIDLQHVLNSFLGVGTSSGGGGSGNKGPCRCTSASTTAILWVPEFSEILTTAKVGDRNPDTHAILKYALVSRAYTCML